DALAARLDRLEQAAEASADQPAGGAPDPRVAELSQAVEGLRNELAKRAAGSAVEEIRTAVAGLSDRIAALENRPAPDLSPLRAAVDDVRAQLRQSAERDGALESRIAALQTQIGSLAPAERLAAVESTLDGFREDARRAGALAPALSADLLANAIASGRPFAAELAAARDAGMAAEMGESVAAHAETGLPSLAAIRESFDRIAPTLETPDLPPPDAGPLDRLMAGARSLVEVRKAGPVEGGDSAATIARIREALRTGELSRALEEWRQLPEEARTASADWARSVQARLDGLAFADRLRSDILTRLGGSAG
ncbi:COG4223 family protein, partial [Propylenella binzhouense]